MYLCTRSIPPRSQIDATTILPQQFFPSQAVRFPGPNAPAARVVAATAPASEQIPEIWDYSMDLTEVWTTTPHDEIKEVTLKNKRW